MKPKESNSSEKKYRELIENSLQGIIIIQEFKVVYANPAFAKITGYTVEELQSFKPHQVMELAHPDDREKLWGNFKKRMAGLNISPHYQFKGLSKQGKTKILELYANRIEYDGKPAIQGFILDITEQVAAQEIIKQRTKLILAKLQHLEYDHLEIRWNQSQMSKFTAIHGGFCTEYLCFFRHKAFIGSSSAKLEGVQHEIF